MSYRNYKSHKNQCKVFAEVSSLTQLRSYNIGASWALPCLEIATHKLFIISATAVYVGSALQAHSRARQTWRARLTSSPLDTLRDFYIIAAGDAVSVDDQDHVDWLSVLVGTDGIAEPDDDECAPRQASASACAEEDDDFLLGEDEIISYSEGEEEEEEEHAQKRQKCDDTVEMFF